MREIFVAGSKITATVVVALLDVLSKSVAKPRTVKRFPNTRRPAGKVVLVWCRELAVAMVRYSDDVTTL